MQEPFASFASATFEQWYADYETGVYRTWRIRRLMESEAEGNPYAARELAQRYRQAEGEDSAQAAAHDAHSRELMEALLAAGNPAAVAAAEQDKERKRREAEESYARYRSGQFRTTPAAELRKAAKEGNACAALALAERSLTSGRTPNDKDVARAYDLLYAAVANGTQPVAVKLLKRLLIKAGRAYAKSTREDDLQRAYKYFSDAYELDRRSYTNLLWLYRHKSSAVPELRDNPQETAANRDELERRLADEGGIEQHVYYAMFCLNTETRTATDHTDTGSKIMIRDELEEALESRDAAKHPDLCAAVRWYLADNAGRQALLPALGEAADHGDPWSCRLLAGTLPDGEEKLKVLTRGATRAANYTRREKLSCKDAGFYFARACAWELDAMRRREEEVKKRERKRQERQERRRQEQKRQEAEWLQKERLREEKRQQEKIEKEKASKRRHRGGLIVIAVIIAIALAIASAIAYNDHADYAKAISQLETQLGNSTWLGEAGGLLTLNANGTCHYNQSNWGDADGADGKWYVTLENKIYVQLSELSCTIYAALPRGADSTIICFTANEDASWKAETYTKIDDEKSSEFIGTWCGTLSGSILTLKENNLYDYISGSSDHTRENYHWGITTKNSLNVRRIYDDYSIYANLGESEESKALYMKSIDADWSANAYVRCTELPAAMEGTWLGEDGGLLTLNANETCHYEQSNWGDADGADGKWYVTLENKIYVRIDSFDYTIFADMPDGADSTTLLFTAGEGASWNDEAYTKIG